MRVRIRRIAEKEKEQVVIECVEVTSQVEDIYAYAKAKGEEICGILTCTIPEEERSRQIERLALDAILYFEAVDDKVFAYTKEKEYEVRIRLYEIEKNTIKNNKEAEIKKLNDKKTNEINRIDNINTNKKQIIKKCIINIIVGIIIILLPIIYVILKFNKLTKLLNNVKESWSSVDILLKQRADLIPNILAVVKGYSKHEKDTLTKITEARNTKRI